MIIRSQDMKEIHNLDRVSNIAVLPCFGNENVFLIEVNRQHTIGTYSTEEKAIKVLDMICEEYKKPDMWAEYSCNEMVIHNKTIFQMPQDSEV